MRGMVIEVSKCVSLNSLLEMREYEDPTAYRYSSVVVSILYWRCWRLGLARHTLPATSLFQFSIGDASSWRARVPLRGARCFNSLLEMQLGQEIR